MMCHTAQSAAFLVGHRLPVRDAQILWVLSYFNALGVEVLMLAYGT